MRGSKTKHIAVLLKVEHARLIEQLAAMKSMTSSEVIPAALAVYLSSHGAEVATKRALDNLVRQLDRMERGQTLLIETFAFFIRDHLACTAPVLEVDDLNARAESRVRFGRFIEQLTCHLQQ